MRLPFRLHGPHSFSRHATTRRAARLAVAGLVLALATLGALPARSAPHSGPVVPPPTPISANGLEAVGYNDLDQPPYCNTEVEVLGATAYVSSWCGQNDRGVTIVDVSSPQRPEVMTSTVLHPGQVVISIAALRVETEAHAGDVLLEALYGRCNPAAEANRPAGLRIWNVDRPAQPELLSELQTGDGIGHVWPFRRDERLYALLSLENPEAEDNNAACGWEDFDADAGLLIADLTDPRAPAIVGRWRLGELGEDLPPQSMVWRARTSRDGKRAYVAAFDAGLLVLDIEHLDAPRLLGRMIYPEADEGNTGSVVELADPRYVAVSDEDWDPVTSRLAVIEPASIAGEKPSRGNMHLAVMLEEGVSELEGPVVWIGRACPADEEAGRPEPDPFRDDPADAIALVEEGACSMGEKILRAQDAGALGAIVFDATPGGAIPNVFGHAAEGARIPGIATTREVGNALTETLAAGSPAKVRLAVEPGAYGYTRIVDVSDPAKPRQVATYEIPETRAFPPVGGGVDWYSAFDLRVEEERLYVSHTGAGLRVVDVSDPLAPIERAHFVPPDRIEEDGTRHLNQTLDSARGEDGNPYLADELSGLWVLRESEAPPEAVYLPFLARGPGHEPAQPAEGWCARLRPGPLSAGDPIVELSEAHIDLRLFGVESAYGPADEALADALGDAAALDPDALGATLGRYASGLGDACALRADPAAELPPARTEQLGDVALIHPGQGPIELPEGVSAVLIDLRGLPAAPELRQALEAALAPALSEALPRPMALQRFHRGPTDEMFSATNVYTNSVRLEPQQPLPARGERDLPILLLTERRMAPEVVAFAGALRMRGRAGLVGEGLRSEVAEATWRPVGEQGIAFRSASLVDRVPRGEPLAFPDAEAQQDLPDDPATASFRRALRIEEEDVAQVRARIENLRGAEGTDLDLFLLRDMDEDGSFHYPDELVSFAATELGEERIDEPIPLPPGAYEIWVHGYDVGMPGTLFDLFVDFSALPRWPDEIPADAPDADRDPRELARWAADALPLEPPAGPALRPEPARRDPYQRRHASELGLGEARAALLVPHGISRRFFPYFDIVGDGIDERLHEVLASLHAEPGLERRRVHRLIRRFGEVLKDGHQFTHDYGSPPYAGYLPVFLDEIEGWPVVRRSLVDGIAPGDAILAVDGRSSQDWFAEEERITSAASDGYRFDIASRFFRYLDGPVELRLRSPEGEERSLVVEPRSIEDYREVLRAPGIRENGSLADLGAEDAYYLNMDGDVTTGIAGVNAALEEMERLGSRGLVLDMRGYPNGINHYEVARRLITETVGSAHFVYTDRSGPDRAEPLRSQYTLTPLDDPSFHGPIVLLTGTHAVSAAENFMIILQGAGRLLAVVGRPSAATNGNITGVQLPGGFAFGYTGMGILFPDGSPFHGIGIQPTVPVSLRDADFAAGVDRDLTTALEILASARGEGTAAGARPAAAPPRASGSAAPAERRQPELEGQARRAAPRWRLGLGVDAEVIHQPAPVRSSRVDLEHEPQAKGARSAAERVGAGVPKLAVGPLPAVVLQRLRPGAPLPR